MEPSKKTRGLQEVKFEDRNGHKCSIRQSSEIDYEADEHCTGAAMLWIGRDDPKIRVGPPWVELKLKAVSPKADGSNVPQAVMLDSHMHMRRAQVQELVDFLTHWLQTGQLYER